ncbi:MAG TPA: glycerophosphodiester phosphodiesterase, partial [Chloroflexota bacterium]
MAHRGASRVAPENSLEALQAAANLGADMAEIDVRRTRDGVLVLHHNRTIRRRRLTAMQHAEAQLADPHLATLDNAVRLAKGRIMLDVELKEEGYEREVLECVSSYLAPSAFVVTSFSLATVERVKQLRPELAAGWI